MTGTVEVGARFPRVIPDEWRVLPGLAETTVEGYSWCRGDSQKCSLVGYGRHREPEGMGGGNRVSYATARRRYESGTLPVPSYRLGRLIVVGEPVTGIPAQAGQTVVYARVSSADQKPDLDRQVARVTVWATGQNLAVDRVVTEVGSALNGHRKRFLALLRDPAVSTIVVEHRDRTPSLSWSLPALRKAWNVAKPEVAPWWAEVSKEAFNTGLDALARGLKNGADSRTGKRAGRPVGFPRFKSRRRTTPSVRFTTGAGGREASTRHGDSRSDRDRPTAR